MAGFRINLKALIIKHANETGKIVTQAQIQQTTGISQPALSRWQNGAIVGRLDFEPTLKLMEFFNCDLCELVSIDMGAAEE